VSRRPTTLVEAIWTLTKRVALEPGGTGKTNAGADALMRFRYWRWGQQKIAPASVTAQHIEREGGRRGEG
jgi:hypothetical protein